jgi:hypothetical protein
MLNGKLLRLTSEKEAFALLHDPANDICPADRPFRSQCDPEWR